MGIAGNLLRINAVKLLPQRHGLNMRVPSVVFCYPLNQLSRNITFLIV